MKILIKVLMLGNLSWSLYDVWHSNMLDAIFGMLLVIFLSISLIYGEVRKINETIHN